MIPTRNIYWREVRKDDDVVVIKSCFIINQSAVAYWLGNESLKARDKLMHLVKLTEKRKNAK